MRYRLAHSKEIKRNRWNKICPICKQPKFSPYIDTVTNEPIAPKECGRCCREKSCAYHMTPSEWFKDNPPEKREWLPKERYIELMRQRRREAEQVSLSYPLPLRVLPLSQRESVDSPIAERNTAEEVTKKNCRPLRGTSEAEQGEAERRGYEVEKYCKRMNDLCHKSRSDRNNLARWLCTQFPEEQVAEVLARYRTGSTRDGRIIYWQIDEHGQVRAGKVMAYDLDGHRKKDGKVNVCWVHSMKIDGIRFDEMLAPQCLFGEHLINVDVNANDNCHPEDIHREAQSTLSFSSSLALQAATLPLVMLVESEKTALFMSLVCPDRVWLATGGEAHFKASMLAPLIGLEVTVYPDADALHDWYTRAVEMNRTLGTHLHIPTGYYNLMDHDEARREGWNLADILLSEE